MCRSDDAWVLLEHGSSEEVRTTSLDQWDRANAPQRVMISQYSDGGEDKQLNWGFNPALSPTSFVALTVLLIFNPPSSSLSFSIFFSHFWAFSRLFSFFFDRNDLDSLKTRPGLLSGRARPWISIELNSATKKILPRSLTTKHPPCSNIHPTFSSPNYSPRNSKSDC